MSTAILQNVEQLLSRHNEPLNFVRHHEDLQRNALEEVEVNQDPLLARDPTNPMLIKEVTATQKEYFRNLKKAQLEQDAKRGFIFAITGEDPPEVNEAEIQKEEEFNAIEKANLKALKRDIENMQVKAVEIAKSNSKKQAALTPRMTEAQTLHKQIKEMELELQRSRAAHPLENRMTTSQAMELVEKYEEEMIQSTTDGDDAKRELEVVRGKLGRSAKDVQRLAKDREREEARAKEVREGREEGEGKVDELCHWLSSSISFYKTLLGIRTVVPISETTVQLEYDIPSSNPITLLLEYDPLSRRLVDASLLGADIDIKEAVDWAVVSNDVPGLIADILNRLRR